MNRREAVIALLAMGGVPLIARSQPLVRIYRVAWISPSMPLAMIIGSEPKNLAMRSFLIELRNKGYIEGKNLIVDRFTGEGHADRYAGIVAESLLRKPDVVVVTGSQLAVVAKGVTSTIPIVMNSVAQPVRYGLVSSLGRPGGNVTGVSADVDPEIEAKRIELLKKLVPKLSRVMCFATKWVWEGPYGEAVRMGATKAGVKLIFGEHKPDDLPGTFTAINRQRPDALVVALSTDVYPQRQEIAEFALRARLPGIYPFAEMVESGGLISYGWGLVASYRRTASYVIRILEGANPGDLPVEQPNVFEMVINRKTAKALRVTIPQDLLLRADRVIE